MTLPETLDTTRISRVAGLTGDRTALVITRPFRAPHHTIADVGLIGGGQVPMPGEVSLAHHGMLLLDELPCSVLYRRQAGTQTPQTPSTAPLPFARAASVLDTIPGIDQRGAELVVAEWRSDMARFGTAARLADRPNLDGLCGGA